MRTGPRFSKMRGEIRAEPHVGEHHRNVVGGVDRNRSERCDYWLGTKEKEKCGKRGMGGGLIKIE